MDALTDFFSFRDANILYVVLGSMLLAASAAVVGAFTLMKKKALVGDAIAHSVLPGICAAFLFAGTKSTILMVGGAFITGWLSLLAIDYITAHSKLKKDAAIGLILSVFFGIGIVMLTFIQRSGNAAQSGLEHFLFGNAAALVGQDLVVFGVLAAVIISTVGLFFNAFTLIAFNAEYAEVLGLPVRRLELLLTSLTVLAVVTGITAVGVVLMAAMLITPAAAARYWTERMRTMVWIAAAIGAFSGFVGAFISFLAPGMPTGPWMVVVSSTIAFVSFFFAPRKGIVERARRQGRNRRLIANENTLKLFYQLGEHRGNFQERRTIDELRLARETNENALRHALAQLVRSQYVKRQQGAWALTEAGITEASRVVRLHRLWELYLAKRMNIAADHVHEDAEAMEHVITPELERELERELGYPSKDPHDSPIPPVSSGNDETTNR